MIAAVARHGRLLASPRDRRISPLSSLKLFLTSPFKNYLKKKKKDYAVHSATHSPHITHVLSCRS